MLVKEPAEYPEPDQDDAFRETHLPEETNVNAQRSAPPSTKAVLFCTLPDQIRHLKWWRVKCFGDNVDVFHMHAEMGNNERTQMQLKFQDSPNPSVFITTPKVGGTDLNLTAANHIVITQNFCILNEQLQAFAQVVRLGQNRVPHRWSMNTGPGVYDDRASNLHKHSGVAQMRVLHGLMSRPNIRTSMIYRILETNEDHTKWVTENGDKLQSDEPLILEC